MWGCIPLWIYVGRKPLGFLFIVGTVVPILSKKKIMVEISSDFFDVLVRSRSLFTPINMPLAYLLNGATPDIFLTHRLWKFYLFNFFYEIYVLASPWGEAPSQTVVRWKYTTIASQSTPHPSTLLTPSPPGEGFWGLHSPKSLLFREFLRVFGSNQQPLFSTQLEYAR